MKKAILSIVIVSLLVVCAVLSYRHFTYVTDYYVIVVEEPTHVDQTLYYDEPEKLQPSIKIESPKDKYSSDKEAFSKEKEYRDFSRDFFIDEYRSKVKTRDDKYAYNSLRRLADAKYWLLKYNHPLDWDPKSIKKFLPTDEDAVNGWMSYCKQHRLKVALFDLGKSYSDALMYKNN